MNRIERLFALRASPAFAPLYDSELAAVAEVATERRLEPGAFLLRAGHPVRHLVVTVEGRLLDGGGAPLAPVFGTAPVLGGARAASDVRADPATGATCLLIARAHVLTLVSELPAMLLALQGTQVSREAGETR